MDPNTLNIIKGAAGVAGGETAKYVEEVFSTYTYDGTSGSNPINNGIDLDGEGGMVWFRPRNTDVGLSPVHDTVRGEGGLRLSTSSDDDQYAWNPFSSINNNGFTLKSSAGTAYNDSSNTYVSWTFRKAPGFFDVVEWVGDDTSGRQIPHSIGSTPGMIIVKCTSHSQEWVVWHRSAGQYEGRLNYPNSFGWEYITGATDTNFTITYAGASTNQYPRTYVAYVFAHDDQRFGDDENKSIIKCGSTSSLAGFASETIQLGFEPQFLLVKPITNNGDWIIADNMRGLYPSLSSPSGAPALRPNTNGAEDITNDSVAIHGNGFTIKDYTGSTGTYVYVAIRRGPMKTPEDATEVFAVESIPQPTSGTTKFTTNFPVDMSWANVPSQGTIGWTQDRLRGYPKYGLHATQGNYPIVRTFDTLTEASLSPNNPYFLDAKNTSLTYGNGLNGGANLSFAFRRAPGFFDVVAWTGDGASYQYPYHNLGVAPELLISKATNVSQSWICSTSISGLGGTFYLDTDDLRQGYWRLYPYSTTQIRATLLSNHNVPATNTTGSTHIAYLFASLDGISKVGSETTDGISAIEVNCGFTAGARFVLIKRTDAAGDWYVYDTTRGIASGNDDFIVFNESDVEDSNDYIDPFTTGFKINSSLPAGTYLYLAIA